MNLELWHKIETDWLIRMEQLEERVKLLEARQKVKRIPKVRIEKQTDQQWMHQLVLLPAYAHVNMDVELAKMDAWLALPKNAGRKRTRSFVLKWLNKIEGPMENGVVPKPPAPPPRIDPIARGQWKQTYGDPKKYGYD